MKKSILVLVCASTMLSGCFATTKRMDFQDLNYYKIDCANKAAQIRFLESQLSVPHERAASSATTGLVSIFDGSYQEKVRISNRSYDAVARGLLWDIRTYCP
jgi:hypothetical protein